MPQRGYSLAGSLSIKQQGPLSLLRLKKRYYFVLDEIGRRIIYYKDEQEFLNSKEVLGTFPLEKTAFSVVEGNKNAFMAHVGERQFELEADNRTSCEAWMEALANRFRFFRDLEYMPSKSDSLRRSSISDIEHLYNNAPDIMKSTLRKLSEQPSEGSLPSLSVLEEKIHRLSLELAGESHPITPSMNEWISNWIQHHKHSIEDRPNSLSTASSSKDVSAESEVFESEHEDPKDVGELMQLRMVNNQQKVEMHKLQRENKDLVRENSMLRDRARAATDSSTSRFLNNEVNRLNKKCLSLEGALSQSNEKNQNLEEQVKNSRKEYVFALQSTIRIPLHDNNSLDVMQVKLIGGDVHKRRIRNLVQEARGQDPSLPTLDSLLSGDYVDAYGFRQYFTDEGLAVHYMATQLHQFYENNEDAARHHKKKWRDYLGSNSNIPLNNETRALCRGGVPNSLRPAVWRLLIHQQVAELKQKHGRYYYRNLCSQPQEERNCEFSPANLKQINLDLLRTMPSNVHFMSANCRGVSQLQQVLRAFCLHNHSLGYCQGMNFLAATALCFLPPEDAFWFLVAVTEKYFHCSYFDSNLTGAQADQEVLKDLLMWKSPNLAAHLASLEVDLTTITLNWFIALFFDTVPFQTLLRIWDVFLLEGPKVLFRFALVLLGHHEQEILMRTDTIGIMKMVKAAVRLCFDIEGLFHAAFCDLKGLPSRTQLRQKQLAYLQVLRERLSKREHIRNMLIKTPSMSSDEVTITDVCPSDIEPNICFIVSGNQTLGLISKVTMYERKSTLEQLDVEFDCRVASLVAVEKDLIFVGLISAYIVAVQIEENDGSVLWEMKLPDTALRLRCVHNRLFALLANGTLTVLENILGKSPANLEMYHVPLGAAPLTDAISMGDNLWVTSGCKISVIDSQNLTSVSTVFVACSTAGGGTPFFEKILCSCKSNHGLFLATAHSTLIQLWSDGVCRLLFDIAFDHRTRKPSLNDDEVLTNIVSLCYVDGSLWVGTSDGYVIIYAVDHGLPDHHSNKFILRRYPPGRRLNPENSAGGESMRAQLCYIPTAEEAEEEENLSRNEFPKKTASKISINIDQDRKDYSVCVTENNNEEKRDGSRGIVRRRSSVTANWMVNIKKSFQKGISSDSVFMPEAVQEPQAKHRPPRNSTGSSNQSMEYDSEYFEMYSDEEHSRSYLALSPRRTWEHHQPKVWDKPTIKRKDLLFDDPVLIAVPEDEVIEEPKSAELNPPQTVETSVELTLTMKLKISDRPVRRVVHCQTDSGPVVVSCSGCITDDEALLVWRKDKDEPSLWINDPVYGPTCKAATQKQSSIEKGKK